MAVKKGKKSKGGIMAEAKMSVTEWLGAHEGKAMTMAAGYRQHLPCGAVNNFIFDEYLAGIGGLPKGRIIEVYGPESSGKTTLVLQALIAAQRRGELAYYIDAEHAFDPNYFETLGGDLSTLVLSQPESGEEAFALGISALKAGWPGIIAYDSVANMVPKAELEGDMDTKGMGLHARLMGRGLRGLASRANKRGVTILFINQIRMKIGVVFGSPETTTGGNALKFYSSMRFDIRSVGKLKAHGKVIGNKTKIRCIKNKCATPFKEAQLELIYGKGFSNAASLFEIARLNNIGFTVKGNTWTIGDKKYIGRDDAKEAFMEDEWLQVDVEAAARKLLRKGKLEVPMVEARE